jgi:hypothetical protein
MGWRGTLRTLGAMARAAERDARRHAREQARQFAAAEKIEQKQRAAEAVKAFDEFLKSLISAHRTCSAPINWKARSQVPPPIRPIRAQEAETRAQLAYDKYRPSIIDRMLRRQEKQKTKLAGAIEAAKEADEEEFKARLHQYDKDAELHADAKELADKILSSDPEAIIEFFRAADPFSSVAMLGESIEIHVPVAGRIAVDVDVHADEIVPKETLRLLESGRVSKKAMPKQEYFRLYQDHVCSSCLRLAREVLALTPVEAVVVTAKDELLDRSTGHMVLQPILSFLALRPTMTRLKFDTLDPSDALKNFLHRMDFRPSSGFFPVPALDPKEPVN